MADGVTAHSSDGGYPATFRNYIVWSTEHMLEYALDTNVALDTTVRQQMLHLLSYALGLKDAWAATRQLLLHLAPNMEQAGIRDAWLPFLQKGLRICRQTNDLATQAELSVHLGILHRLLGEWDEAWSYFEASLQNFTVLNDHAGQAKALNRLAFLQRLQGAHDEASTLVAKALALCEDGNETHAMCHSTQGAISLDKHEWQIAQYHFEQALTLWERNGNLRMTALGHSDLGVCQWRQTHFLDAIQSFELAVALFEEVQDHVQMAAARMNLGLVYTDLRDYRKALDLYALAEPVFQEVRDGLRLAMLYNNRGFAFRHLHEWKSAERAYRLSIQCWQKLQNPHALANVVDGLGVVYKEQGLAAEAARLFQDALQVLALVEDEADQGRLRQMIHQHLREDQRVYELSNKIRGPHAESSDYGG